MKKSILLLGTIILLLSCTDEKQEGDWDDNIKLSTDQANFSVGTDSVTITTGGDWWWISEITFDDSVYSYYDRADIDLESDAYSISEAEFSVERRDPTTLFVKIHANPTGSERTMKIILEAGDYFDQVRITQAGQ